MTKIRVECNNCNSIYNIEHELETDKFDTINNCCFCGEEEPEQELVDQDILDS